MQGPHIWVVLIKAGLFVVRLVTKPIGRKSPVFYAYSMKNNLTYTVHIFFSKYMVICGCRDRRTCEKVSSISCPHCQVKVFTPLFVACTVIDRLYDIITLLRP